MDQQPEHPLFHTKTNWILLQKLAYKKLRTKNTTQQKRHTTNDKKKVMVKVIESKVCHTHTSTLAINFHWYRKKKKKKKKKLGPRP